LEAREALAVKRREFITLLSGAAVWPLAARGQQAAMPVIGWLSVTRAEGYADRVAAFNDGLNETGFGEGQNVVVEYRWADDHDERLSALAADLVRQRVAVLVAGGGTSTALAAKAASATIPIVFVIAADPVRAGIVGSLNRPGGNITGVVGFTDSLIVKRLELLTELVPGASIIGALLNRRNPNAENRSKDLQAAARVLGREIRFVWASSPDELDNRIAAAIEQRVGALVVQNDAMFTSHRDRIVELAARHRLPTIYETREEAMAGGLVTYGASTRFRYRQLGIYTGRILKGEKPGDLPIMQPTKFELIINLKTAKALGLPVPDKLLALADEVIE
jgi:putative tryptophan/tyrosine transport system substrate-binding protein